MTTEFAEAVPANLLEINNCQNFQKKQRQQQDVRNGSNPIEDDWKYYQSDRMGPDTSKQGYFVCG
jgi:hypothetical protein